MKNEDPTLDELIAKQTYYPNAPKKIIAWHFKTVTDHCRLYFWDDGEPGDGGYFYVVESMQGIHWEPDMVVRTLCHGWAAFDGVRHIYWGEDYGCNGYDNYPNWSLYRKVISTLEEQFPDFS